MRVAILASGNGSNFEALAKSFEAGEIEGELALLFSDKKNSYALERAKNHQVPAYSFSPKDFASKAEYETELLALLKENRIELVVLAGYMRLIGLQLLEAYPNKIINIHPSLLPNFPGLHGIKDAYEAGVKETGVTVHYVDSGVDTGPVIAQEKVAITSEDTLESLEEKIHHVEHQIYPKVIARIIKGA